MYRSPVPLPPPEALPPSARAGVREEPSHETILRTLKAAAEPNRLRILRILAGGPFHVAELTEVLGIAQSTVSRHLRVLSEAGLVTVQRAGAWAFYTRSCPGGGGFPGRFLEFLGEALEDGPNSDRAAVERVLARRRRQTAEFFRRTARLWDTLRERTLGPPTYLNRLLELVGAANTVVDLGTGTGFLLESLRARASRVIGVDASPEMLEEARRRGGGGGLRGTELRLGTLEHLPLGDGEADVMVANMVLHHVADVPSVLRELRRALAPGGRLVIADLEAHQDEMFWRSLGARWPGFRRSEIHRWLAAAGFCEIHSEEAAAEEPAGVNEGVPSRPPVFLVAARGPGEPRNATRS